jgi:hypothetical protein
MYSPSKESSSVGPQSIVKDEEVIVNSIEVSVDVIITRSSLVILSRLKILLSKTNNLNFKSPQVEELGAQPDIV